MWMQLVASCFFELKTLIPKYFGAIFFFKHSSIWFNTANPSICVQKQANPLAGFQS